MLTRDFVASLSKRLAQSPADAQPLLAEATARGDADEVAAVLLARLEAGQAVALDEVLPWVRDLSVADLLLALVSRATGKVADAVATLLADDALDADRLCLLVAAAALHLDGAKVPAKLKAQVIRLAKRDLPDSAYEVLVAACHQLGDDEVLAARQSLEKWMTAADLKQVTESLALDAQSPLELLPEGEVPLPQLTVKHEGKEPGRNDPCPCGSGQKYKKCHGADGPRSAAGGTRAERLAALGPQLSAKHVQALWLSDLRALDPATLTVESHLAGARRLIALRRWADAERWWKAYVPRVAESSRDAAWEELLWHAASDGEDALVERCRAALTTPDAVGKVAELQLALRKLPPAVAAMNQVAGQALARSHFFEAVDLAYALLQHAPALGVLVGDGLLPKLANRAEAEDLWWAIDVARDALGLGRVPFLGKGGRPVAARDRSGDRAPTAPAAPAPSASADSAPYEELEAARRRIIELEGQLSAASQPGRTQAAPEGARRELRSRVDELEERIREGNEERARLRREVAELSARLSAPKDEAPQEPEAELPEPEGVDGSQARPRGLTLPRFVPRAREALEALPARVAREVLLRVSDLCSGEAPGWREVKQLQGVAGLFSARVGIHYRVLFRPAPEVRELVIEDVVAREAFDTAIRRYK